MIFEISVLEHENALHQIESFKYSTMSIFLVTTLFEQKQTCLFLSGKQKRQFTLSQAHFFSWGQVVGKLIKIRNNEFSKKSFVNVLVSKNILNSFDWHFNLDIVIRKLLETFFQVIKIGSENWISFFLCGNNHFDSNLLEKCSWKLLSTYSNLTFYSKCHIWFSKIKVIRTWYLENK